MIWAKRRNRQQWERKRRSEPCNRPTNLSNIEKNESRSCVCISAGAHTHIREHSQTGCSANYLYQHYTPLRKKFLSYHGTRIVANVFFSRDYNVYCSNSSSSNKKEKQQQRELIVTSWRARAIQFSEQRDEIYGTPLLENKTTSWRPEAAAPVN